MEWYWWVVIAVAVLVLAKVMFGGDKAEQPRENELSAIFQRSRDERTIVDQELVKVVELVADLFVSPPNSVYPNILSRDGLQNCVANFLQEAGLTGLRTHTKMLHVVMSPVQITVLVKLKPARPRTAVREFIRIGEDEWAFGTRHAEDMERAIREADQESDRVVAMMKRAATTPVPPAAPPQSPPPAERQAARSPTDPAVEIAAELGSAPLPRKRMNLLWVGKMQLQVFKAMAKGGYTNIAFVDLGSDVSAPAAELLQTIMRQISDGQVTAQDIEWAIRVDAIAGEAEDAFKRGDVLEAIERYRDALQEAPGCDVYLMSMGACYAELGALRDATRYYERAAEISPQNARIARNLADVRAALHE